MDLQTAQRMLDAYLAAETAVLAGKEYSIAGRVVKRSDLDMIQSGRTYWESKVASLTTGGGIRIQFPGLAG